MKKSNAGFTLIELVIVIVILGILAATALPRFMDVSSGAHKMSVENSRNALNAGIQMVRAKWYAEGANGTTVKVRADTDLPVTDGFPTATNNAGCVAIWNALVERATVAVAAGSDYRAAFVSETCEYTYQKANDLPKIVYTFASGEVALVEVATP